MRHRRFAVVLAQLCLIAAATTAAASAQQPQPAMPPQAQSKELAATLALPITPGSIALLVESGSDPAVQQRMRDALQDSRPGVRKVAARTAFGAGLRMLIPDLRAALKAEQNPTVGAEELRALMTFSPPLTAECIAAAVRLQGDAATEAVNTLARLDSPELPARLHELEQAHASPSAVSHAWTLLMTKDPSARARLLQEHATDPEAVDAALASIKQPGDLPNDDLLIALLKSTEERVRVVTAWQLARSVSGGIVTLSPAIQETVKTLAADNATNVTWEALGIELLARAGKLARHERSWSDLSQPGRSYQPLWNDHDDRKLLRPLLTDAETHDIADALHISYEVMTKSSVREETIVAARRLENLGIRTVPPLASDLWGELLKLTRCETKHRGIVMADVAYRPDGRPRQISISKDVLVPEECNRVARTLFSLTIAQDVKPIPAAFVETLVLPLEAPRVACIDQPWAIEDGSEPVRFVDREHGSSKIKPPTPIKKVNPTYPPVAQASRIEGTVIIEAGISRTGCVSQATVVASPHPSLSGAALFAVLDWRYSTTYLDDKPVPVIMTITVNFALEP